MKQTSSPDFFQLAFGDGTPKKALMTALVVGTILATINHGDVILKGESINYIFEDKFEGAGYCGECDELVGECECG